MWIQISSGRGPVECSRAVYLFYQKVLKKILEKGGVSFEIISKQADLKKDTYKSIIILTNNKVSQEILKLEGSVKWICNSSYRKNHKRKNWFINVSIYEQPEKFSFCESDVEVQTTHSSGPGGQNVNKVETAVKVIHKPTGLTVNSQDERSQLMNKRLAFAKLEKLLACKSLESEQQKISEVWTQHNNLKRGNAVKVYKGETFKEA